MKYLLVVGQVRVYHIAQTVTHQDVVSAVNQDIHGATTCVMDNRFVCTYHEIFVISSSPYFYSLFVFNGMKRFKEV